MNYYLIITYYKIIIYIYYKTNILYILSRRAKPNHLAQKQTSCTILAFLDFFCFTK